MNQQTFGEHLSQRLGRWRSTWWRLLIQVQSGDSAGQVLGAGLRPHQAPSPSPKDGGCEAD